MIHGLTFKEYVEEEKTKLSEMTKAEKIDYFKEYYLKLTIVLFIVLVLIVWFVIDIARNMKNDVVTGGVVNTVLSTEGRTYLSDDYLNYLQLSSRKNRANLAPDIFLDGDDPQAYTIFQAEIATNSYNYIISDEKGLDFVAKNECAADMNEVLPGDLKSEFKDKMIYRKSGESDTEIAAAIDITDTAFVKDFIIGDRVYFVISGKIEEYDSGIAILRYILEKK